MRFGKESEPALTASGELFATGLSPKGKLTSANDTRSFYGAPLVAWTTALGAEVYEVQWSKTKVPFTARDGSRDQRARDDDAQHLRGAPAHVRHLVLPRARLRLLAADRRAGHVLVRAPSRSSSRKPTFAIVGGTATIGTTSYRVPAGGFSVSVPSHLGGVDRKAAGVALKTKPALVAYLGPKLKSLASGGSSLRFVAYDPNGSTVSTALVVQASADRNAYTRTAWVQSVTAQARKLGSSVSAPRSRSRQARASGARTPARRRGTRRAPSCTSSSIAAGRTRSRSRARRAPRTRRLPSSRRPPARSASRASGSLSSSDASRAISCTVRPFAKGSHAF